jgi:polysaccharide deacetylase family protein (PEP-CTERM system associated)
MMGVPASQFVSAEATRPRNCCATGQACLSIDVEEYFHGEVFARCVTSADWPRLERRAAPRLERLAEMLARSESRATFFVLGWTIPYLAPLLRELLRRGHELACHGDGHAHLARLTPQELREDLRRARERMADALGVAPRGYRAPTFSITRRTAWALDILLEAGFTYDASIFPIHHDRYGVPGAPGEPFWAIAPSGQRLLEFPPLTLNCGWGRLPLGGGGYLRLLPGWLVRWGVRRALRRGTPVMLYVHPWELDPQQPRLPIGALAQWRHRVNLQRTEGRLARLLSEVRFDTAGAVLDRLDRTRLPTYALVSPQRLA